MESHNKLNEFTHFGSWDGNKVTRDVDFHGYLGVNSVKIVTDLALTKEQRKPEKQVHWKFYSRPRAQQGKHPKKS